MYVCIYIYIYTHMYTYNIYIYIYTPLAYLDLNYIASSTIWGLPFACGKIAPRK